MRRCEIFGRPRGCRVRGRIRLLRRIRQASSSATFPFPRGHPPLPLSTLAPPPPQTIPPHPGPGYKAVKLEEIRRLCAQGRSDGLTDPQMKHMHKFYCKLGAGFCLVSTGGAVSGLSGSLAAWAPWMAAGVWMSCSAAKSLQTAASLPGVDGRVDGAELVRRGGSLGGGGEGLGH